MMAGKGRSFKFLGGKVGSDNGNMLEITQSRSVSAQTLPSGPKLVRIGKHE
jgi:hypothetical protein